MKVIIKVDKEVELWQILEIIVLETTLVEITALEKIKTAKDKIVLRENLEEMKTALVIANKR